MCRMVWDNNGPFIPQHTQDRRSGGEDGGDATLWSLFDPMTVEERPFGFLLFFLPSQVYKPCSSLPYILHTPPSHYQLYTGQGPRGLSYLRTNPAIMAQKWAGRPFHKVRPVSLLCCILMPEVELGYGKAATF